MKQARIIFLPFAGGSRYSYVPFANGAPDHLETVSVEMPGRGMRFKEPLLHDIDSMVEDAYQQLKDQLDLPYVLFGHCLGALMGYLLIRRFKEDGLRLPLHLFASSCYGPISDNGLPSHHLLPSAQFWKELGAYGEENSPYNGIQGDRIRNLFEPILRADFESMDSFKYREGPTLEVPITALRGDKDPILKEDVETWQRETVEFEMRTFPGPHFFIFEHMEEILKMIDKALRPLPQD